VFVLNIYKEVQGALGEILDLGKGDISPETYIIRQLDAESIDLLELAVELNLRCKVEINDEDIFLRSLRVHLNEAKEEQKDPLDHLMGKFPFLGKKRIADILLDLEDGPVLKVKDVVSYVEWQRAEVEKIRR
jgi:acyl carrier protein